MLGGTAFVKQPSGTVGVYALSGKTPAEVTPLPKGQQEQLLRGARMESIDGSQAMHFSMEIAEDMPLDEINLLFAGGAKPGQGSQLSYHGGTRGSFTLNLFGTHYTYHTTSPNPPPQPLPPAAPSCFLDGTVETVEDDLPCSAPLADGVQLDYALDATHLRAEVRCTWCDPNGWLALGFPITVTSDVSESGTKTAGAAVLGFPQLPSGGEDGGAWSLRNLDENFASKNTMKKTRGRDKGYDAVATSVEGNVVELLAKAPFAKEWFRLCLTADPKDSQKCEHGAMIGFHPKRRVFTGCGAFDNKAIGKFNIKSILSIRYNAEKGFLVLRRDSGILRTCPTTTSSLYAKVFVFRRGTSISGVKMVTTPQASSMVRKHAIGSHAGSDFMRFTEMAASLQTLVDTSVESLDDAVTMGFSVRLGEVGVPADLSTAPAQVLFAQGSYSAVDSISCGRSNWSISTINLIDSSLPPSSIGPAPSPAPPPPTCDSTSLAGVAGYPCTADLGGFMQLFYFLTATELRARIHCPTCKGWVALGFADVPGAMTGGTAIIGNTGPSNFLATVNLNGKKREQVQTNVGASLQLREASTNSEQGVTISFAANLGQGGVPKTLSTANLLFAAGSSKGLSYHAARRGAVTIEMVTLPPLATSVGVALEGQKFGQAAEGGDNPNGSGTDNTLVGVLSAFAGFAAGCILVVVIVKRMSTGGKGKNLMLRDSLSNVDQASRS